MPKEQNLKDYLDGNELDLSLHNLTAVPVKELAAIPKATSLDLSCNQLTFLPDSFCSLLTHVVKIDLSKNSLSDLPDNFGLLCNLQHLDLLGNRLSKLPVSFCQLQKLKWLDLKDNPLEEDLKKTAGDCLDEQQCRKCAQMILQHMKKIETDLEKKRKKKETEKRDREQMKKQREEKEKEKKKQEKLAEKARKRQEYEAQKAAQNAIEEEEKIVEPVEEVGLSNGYTTDEKRVKSGGSVCASFCYSLLISISLLIAIIIGVSYVCDTENSPEYCKTYWQQYKQTTKHYVNVYWKPVEDVIWQMYDTVCLQLKQIIDNFTDNPSSNDSSAGKPPKQSATTK